MIVFSLHGLVRPSAPTRLLVLRRVLSRFPALLLFLMVLFGFSPLSAASTEFSSLQPAEHAPPIEELKARRLEALDSLLQKIINQRREINKLTRTLNKTATEQEREQIAQQAARLREELAEQDDTFMQLLTGMSLSVYTQSPPREESNFLQELQAIFTPLVNALKDMTERSRKIEQLRGEIAAIRKLEERIEGGLRSIDALEPGKEFPALGKALKKARESIDSRLKELREDRLIKEEQLANLRQADEGLGTTLRRFFQDVFGSHVTNFLLTLFVVALSYLGIRYAYRKVLYLPHVSGLFNSVHWVRIVDASANLVTFLFALLLGLFVLYVRNDWIVLGLMALFALGFLWSIKDNLPTQMVNGQLLMNIGAVRQGERVVRNGVPWEVQPIGYFTYLVNPALEGGKVRIPLDELGRLSSRPFSRNDRWFPTAKHDWVLLDDGVYGQVVLQTPEMVVVRLYSASEKSYTTADYLALSPQNLSRGFGVFMTFGLDYAHQEQVTATVPRILERELREGLAKAALAERLEDLFVEFSAAGTSSLDVAVYARFPGELAESYYRIRRLLSRLLVESCTAHGWTIPFTQITVHGAGADEAARRGLETTG